MTIVSKQLETLIEQRWQAFTQACEQQNLAIPNNSEFNQSWSKVFAVSDFVSTACIKEPHIIIDLVNSNDLFRTYSSKCYVDKVYQFLDQILAETDLIRQTRQLRRREMVRIAWRDLAGFATLQETVHDLSKFADTIIDFIAKRLYRWKISTSIIPKIEQQLVVIAVGKLGANELNFSSDIDLIFTYGLNLNCDDETALTLQQFFISIAQQLIKVLGYITQEGFVFRVDMRLRPFGASGPLVMSTARLLDYYQTTGRTWERYALSRARIISGDDTTKTQVYKIVDQFVYRAYLDYGVIESLRQIKQIIQRESLGLENDIKRGEGGIREIEFIVQVIQLIRGGKEPWLKQTSILALLPQLAAKKIISNKTAMELLDAYDFFRQVEHRLQEFADQQTQAIPKDEISKNRLAFSMQFKAWDDFIERLNFHREKVASYFNASIAKPKISNKISNTATSETILAWLKDQISENQIIPLLKKLHAEDPEKIYQLLSDFKQSPIYLAADQKEKADINYILMHGVTLLMQINNQAKTFSAILQLFKAIIKPTFYLALLVENPKIWPFILSLYSASAWLAEQINLYPFLLEELLDSETLYTPYSTARLEDELQQFLLAIPQDDLDLQMEYLRRFKLIQLLRVAAADIKGVLPLMKVSDHLTFTADAILRYVQNIAWHNLSIHHGKPCVNNQSLTKSCFAIVAYGKLGGIELGYHSDLDLVFIHTKVEPEQMTDGEKAITNLEFFTRLAQKIIQILNTPILTGILYAIDTRLRPSGQSGLLVTNIAAFSDYQLQTAWTWEHQALIRTRMITGSKELQEQFAKIRFQTLTMIRDSNKLRHEVLTMRDKMRAQTKFTKGTFNIIQGRGGIKDIEFIVQFLVLKCANQFPNLIEYTDNIRILEGLAIAGILLQDEMELLCDAYRYFRQLVHRANLQNTSTVIPLAEAPAYREQVKQLWQKFLL